MQRRLLKTLLCAAGTLVLASAALADDAVKIGVTQPLTGAFAADGNYVAQGAKLAAEAINKAGGVDGKQIQLVIEDNKSNPTEAAATAERLIGEDKVPVMLGAWGSSLTLAVMPKLLEYKVPMVVETSSSGKITTSGNPYIFRIAPTSAMEAKVFAEKAAAALDPPIKKVDFLAVNNDFGRGASDEFKKALQAKGVEIGRTETMTPDATDLSAQLAALKQSGGDTLFVTSGVEQITLIIKQAAEQRLPARIVTTGGSFPDALLGDAGKGFESRHLLFFNPWFPEAAPHAELAKGFVDAWKKKDYEFAGATEGFRGYDAILTIAAALKQAGKAEAEPIRAALWETKLPGVNGDIAFTKDGPAGKESGQNVPNIYVVHLKDGQVVKN